MILRIDVNRSVSCSTDICSGLRHISVSLRYREGAKGRMETPRLPNSFTLCFPLAPVAGVGFEPTITDYEPVAVDRTRLPCVASERIELPFTAYETVVLPLN